jgi:subtilase family serine protease
MTRGRFKTALTIASLVCAAGCAPQEPDELGNVEPEIATIVRHPYARVCDGEPAPGHARCHALVQTDENGIVPFSTPLATTVSGFGPSDLASAYKLPATGGSGATIAIVDAYDDPNAESDLAFYRSHFGLPACTTANGCFKKVNQKGSTTSLPAANSGWAGEIALDIEMASAVCPKCKIVLVEASSTSFADLGAAVNAAVSLGATVVSNSYGGGESSGETSEDTFYNHPGVGIFVSSGDGGYGVEFPASSTHVTAVGGTSLAKSSAARGWVESVWGTAKNTNGGAGSGCSKYEAKPSYQKDTGCTKRTVADESAIADPSTGVAVYDTYGGKGWAVYGGTSVASPVVASIHALTGHGGDSLGFSYAHTSSFFDVTSGTNGSCSGSYLCTGKAGYDGPTGNGTPNAAAW